MTLTKLWAISILLTFILFIFAKESKAQMTCYPIYGGTICNNTQTGQTIRTYTQPNGVTVITPTIQPEQPKAPPIINYGCLLALGCLDSGK